MFYFTADARDGFSTGGNPCNSCCAEVASAIPGETNKWRINYCNWTRDIGGRGLVGPIDFSFKKLTSDPVAPFPSTLPPTNIDYQLQIGANMPYTGDVSTSAVSPQSTPLTFSVDPVNPPSHGTVAMNSNGTYIYVPSPGYTGIDQFTYLTMDSINAPVKNQVIFGVDTVITDHFSGSLPVGVINLSSPEAGVQVYQTPIPPSPGRIYVDSKQVFIRNPLLDFSVTCTPETLIDQIYRLTIAIQAMECSGTTFRHISSYDIRISPCGLP